MRQGSGEAPARAALAGNPSDGYGGRTLAVTLPALRARVQVEPSVRPDVPDRLLGAALLQFVEGTGIDPGPVRMRFITMIPEQVGLAGSSAIVVAALRALAAAARVDLEPRRLATLALEAETEVLGIAAGPQDRVAQAHGGLLSMDFDARHGPSGAVQRLDPALLPPLFVAWQREPAGSSGIFHADLRSRHEEGDPAVHDGMKLLTALAAEARDALLAGDVLTFERCMDASFDARRAMAPLDPDQVRMVEAVRDLGAAANFAGSGGAVVGTLPARVGERELRAALPGCEVYAPARVDGAEGPPQGMSG
jgi:glucuronokinase